MKRIHEATSPAEWDGRRDGLLVDVFRRITSVPAVTRRCAEKRQKKKRKGDYEEESERRPKTATLRICSAGGQGAAGKEKALIEAIIEEQRRELPSLPPAFESNPMRQYGLSDDYMAQLKRHLSRVSPLYLE